MSSFQVSFILHKVAKNVKIEAVCCMGRADIKAVPNLSGSGAENTLGH